MKTTQKELENAILCIAELFGQKDTYKSFINDQVSLPKMIEMLAYQMFLHEFKPDENLEQYGAYNLIHEYAIEIRDNGGVTFIK